MQPPLVYTQQQTIIPTTHDTIPLPYPVSQPQVFNNDSNYSDDEDDNVTTQPRVLQQTPRVVWPPPRVQPNPTTPSPRLTTTFSPQAQIQTVAYNIAQETILHLLHQSATPLTIQQAAVHHFPWDVLAAILDTNLANYWIIVISSRIPSTAPFGKIHMVKSLAILPRASPTLSRELTL